MKILFASLHKKWKKEVLYGNRVVFDASLRAYLTDLLKTCRRKTEARIQNTKGLVVEEIAHKQPKNSEDTTEKSFQIFKHAIYYDSKPHLQARNSKLITHILANADEDYLGDLLLYTRLFKRPCGSFGCYPNTKIYLSSWRA